MARMPAFQAGDESSILSTRTNIFMNNKPSPWKTLSTRTVYKNPWITIREDEVIRPDGSEGIYGILDSNDSIEILVLNDKNELALIEQFRYPSQKWKWEFPGGIIDEGDALKGAQRELQEETGLAAKEWTKLGELGVCNGFMSETMHVFVARDLSDTGTDDRLIEGIQPVAWVSLDEIDDWIADGRMCDGQSISSLYLLRQWLK